MRAEGFVNPLYYKYVVFSSDTDLWFLRCLKSGFRHCLFFTGDENQVIIFDPVANRFDISYIPMDVNLVKKFFEDKGDIVVAVDKKFNPRFRVSIGVFTCVEVVKRILGISNAFIITPFRLYKYLTK